MAKPTKPASFGWLDHLNMPPVGLSIKSAYPLIDEPIFDELVVAIDEAEARRAQTANLR